MTVTVGGDGTISAISTADQPGGAPNVLGRIKLVNPPEPTWCAATTACSA
jgi:flagellar basal-body rod protein FlgF